MRAWIDLQQGEWKEMDRRKLYLEHFDQYGPLL